MKNKRIDWFVIWIVLLCVMLMATVSYGAYTSVKYFKSVAVAKKEGNDIRFSSNYLDLRMKEEDSLVKVIAANGNPVSVAITVCNYSQNEPDKAHKQEITYDITINILDAEGKPLEDFIEYQKSDGTIGSLTKADLLATMHVNSEQLTENYSKTGEKLTGVNPAQNVYNITCTNPDILSAISIKMAAVPDECKECDLDNFELTARIKILVSKLQSGWTGYITDGPMADAFNFEMSGTTEETMILSWDNSKVEISPWSKNELGIKEVTQNNGRAEAIINVGKVGKPTSYRLQFYRTSAIPTDEDVAALKQYVTLNRKVNAN